MADLDFMKGIIAQPQKKQADNSLSFMQGVISAPASQPVAQPTVSPMPSQPAPPAPLTPEWDSYYNTQSEPGLLDKANKFVNKAADQLLPMREIEETKRNLRRNFILPISVALEDAAEYVGLENDHRAQAELKRVNEQIKKQAVEISSARINSLRNDLKGLQPNSPEVVALTAKIKQLESGEGFTAADAQGFIAELGLPALKTKKAIAGVEAALNTVRGIANRGETGSGKELALDAAIGAGSAIAGKLLWDKSAQIIKDKFGSNVLSTVQKFAERKGINKDELELWLKGVPKEKQAYVLANRLGEAAEGIMKKAALNSDDAATEMLRRSQQRVKNIEAKADIGKAEEHMAVVTKNYQDMLAKVDGLDIGLDTKGLFEGIRLSKVEGWQSNPVMNKLITLKDRVDADPVMNLSEAMTLKQSLNALAGKALPDERALLTKVRNRLDEVIDRPGNLPEEVSAMIKQANKDYNIASQNRDLASIVDKSKDGKGIINYKTLETKIREEGLDTYEAKAVTNMLKEYEKKFSNDYKVFIPTAGTNPSNGWWGLMSAAIGMAKSTFYRIGESGNNIAMQKLITKDLKNSKTPYHFAATVATNHRLPNEVRSQFLEMLQAVNKADITAYDMNMLKQIEPTLAKGARALDLQVRRAEIAVDRRTSALKDIQAKAAVLRQHSGNEKALEDKIAIAKKELGLAKAKYDTVKNEFDKLNVTVDNIKGFNNRPAADDLPEVYKQY